MDFNMFFILVWICEFIAAIVLCWWSINEAIKLHKRNRVILEKEKN